jgi:hypothetical protein
VFFSLERREQTARGLKSFQTSKKPLLHGNAAGQGEAQ